jgi:hypothetical protein
MNFCQPFLLYLYFGFPNIYLWVLRGGNSLKKAPSERCGKANLALDEALPPHYKGFKKKNIFKKHPLQKSKSAWPIETNINSGPTRIR